MAVKAAPSFDPKAFLAKVGEGRSIDKYRKDQPVFSQGEPADAVFYIQKGKVKITVVSAQGKEAVVAILGPDDFFGEGCLVAQPRRIATVTAMMDSTIMRLEKAAMIQVIHDEPAFSETVHRRTFWRAPSASEEDLVDQLFNSSEKRLHGSSCFWRISAKTEDRRRSSQRSVKRRSLKWSARRVRELAFS